MSKPRLVIPYRRPRHAGEGVRRELRILRTHLGHLFDLKLVGQDGDGSTLPLELWVRIVDRLLVQEPTPDNARELFGLYRRASLAGPRRPGTITDIAVLLEDASGVLERSVTRRFLGGRIHEKARSKRNRLGREENVLRTYQWVLQTTFLGLSSSRIEALQAVATANRRSVDVPFLEIHMWPWWYLRFLSNWQVHRDLPKRITTYVSVYGKKIEVYVQYGASVRAWSGADLVVVPMDRVVESAMGKLEPGVTRFLIKMRPDVGPVTRQYGRDFWKNFRSGDRIEFDVSGLRQAIETATNRGVSLEFDFVRLEGVHIGIPFMRNILMAGTVPVRELVFKDCDVGRSHMRELDLSNAKISKLSLIDIDVDTIELPPSGLTLLNLENKQLFMNEKRSFWKPWRPFDAPATHFADITSLSVKEGVVIDDNFLRAVSGMTKLVELKIQDPPIKWQDIVMAIITVIHEIDVTFTYKKTKIPPYPRGVTWIPENIEVIFE